MKQRDLAKEGMQRAYSVFEIKSVDGAAGAKRTFTGIATTPTTDLSQDIIEPLGAEFALPIALLWQHQSKQPIGWVTDAKVTAKGIEISGEVADVPLDGPLKTFLLDVWQMLQAKIVRGLSIGFSPIEHSQIDGTWGYRYTKWRWHELSCVTVACNPDAMVTSIKAIKEADFAARAQQRKASRVIAAKSTDLVVTDALGEPQPTQAKAIDLAGRAWPHAKRCFSPW